MQSEIDSLHEEAVILIGVLYYEWRIFGKISEKTKSEFSDLAKLIARKQKEKTMSWGIKIVGRTKDVLAEVKSNQYVPQYVKDTVAAIAADNQAMEGAIFDGLSVIGYGHQGGKCPSSIKFEVEPLVLAPTAPESPVETAAPEPPKAEAAAPIIDAPLSAPASTGSA